MPKLVDHITFKTEILRKVYPIFIEKGYLSVTMRDLASSLGISTGSLYHYFETKEQLFDSMVYFVVEEDTSELEGQWKSDEKEEMEILIQYLENKSTHFQSLLVLALDISREEALHHKFNSLIKDSVQKFERILEERFPDTGAPLLSFIIGELYKNLIVNHPIRWNKSLRGFLSK
ncbi:TetR/AcrR family transcriptional regulator [Leptospira idonii]|uniref:TetR/AcrR family transcriptional regulator n=1 Tax=Leptospira idonii TaxID=1193500 RepID=A0A4R9LV76_9LEPT|nr:TetR/AcrR family transcriptional regulator [Leptospira idonii]TGN18134.1 TetR/AcrR family transcriptional regulator [Leptospira idonii]